MCKSKAPKTLNKNVRHCKFTLLDHTNNKVITPMYATQSKKRIKDYDR